MIVTVCCVKWGAKYPAHYVNRLRGMVARNLSAHHEFICLTDDATGLDDGVQSRPLTDCLQGWWNKITLFKPGTLPAGRLTLYFDLDVVIVGSLDFLLDCRADFSIAHDAYPGKRVNSSIMVFRPETCADIYNRFAANPETIINLYPGDQEFIGDCRPDAAILPREKIRSFKYETSSYAWPKLFRLHKLLRKLPTPVALTTPIPDGASIIVFHGQPKPDDVIDKPFGPYKRAPWIAEHWR